MKGDFQICISVPLKEFQLRCEVCDLCSYTEMLINTDMTGISFLTKMYQFIF